MDAALQTAERSVLMRDKRVILLSRKEDLRWFAQILWMDNGRLLKQVMYWEPKAAETKQNCIDNTTVF